jgi:hypothetical protein
MTDDRWTAKARELLVEHNYLDLVQPVRDRALQKLSLPRYSDAFDKHADALAQALREAYEAGYDKGVEDENETWSSGRAR